MHTTSWQHRWERAPAAARGLLRVAAVWLVATGFLTAPRQIAAQQFTFRHYAQMDGGGNLSVNCLLQDHAGFIWMCTDNGLFRHDGVDWERFGEIQGLGSPTIRSAVEDPSGVLWVGTSQDLYRLGAHGFRAIRPEGRALGLAAGSRIAALSPLRMLVIDAGQLMDLNAAAPEGDWHSQPYFTEEQRHAHPELNHLGSLQVDAWGRIWLGCGPAICRVVQSGVTVFDEDAGVPEDTWRSWLLDGDGRLWVRGSAHLVVLASGTNRFESRDPPHGRLNADSSNGPLALDPQGRILAGSEVGLSRWQSDGWQDFTGTNGIPHSGISAILVSRDGQVWLGSRGHGLGRWLGYGHFESWTMVQGLGDNRVGSLARGADQSVLVATRAGCSRLDPAARAAAPCRFDGLPRGEIRVMAQGGGALWIGMTTGALFRIGAGESQATWVANLPSMHKLMVDSLNRLWIGTSSGVDVVEAGATEVRYLSLPGRAGEVTDVTEDAHGAIWLATQGGLLRWSDGRWLVLGIDDEYARAGFGSVTAAEDGWLWAAGASHGMLHLHVAGDGSDHLQWVSDPMLSHAVVRFTRIDARGRVWAGTDAGVVVFDGQLWRRFNIQDGLIWNDTLENSFLADADGSVWVGTSGGLTHIQHPEALLETASIDLRFARATLGTRGIDAEPIRRPWEPNLYLKLHLQQLSFGTVGRSYLRVRLRGLADEWVDTRSHEVYYPALGPGHYRFEAVAIDPDHRQRSALVHLSFEILPPWWQAPWLRQAAAAALLVMLGIAGYWWMRRLRARRLELERREQEHEALIVRATRDPLTGLWNRATILEILAREIKAARRHRTPLAVAIIDVDHFKRVNDSRGHLAGDEVLRQLGAKLNGRVRGADSLGRYGGEEFLLVAPGAPSQRPFLPIERLHRAVAETPIVYAGSAIKVTASFGVAWLETATDTPESLLSRADAALYSAKDAGRDRVEYAATG